MTTQYKALQPVGRFVKGDIVGNLPAKKIEQLLESGVIEAVKPTKTEAVKAEVKK